LGDFLLPKILIFDTILFTHAMLALRSLGEEGRV